MKIGKFEFDGEILNMYLEKIYKEEDLFPKEITFWEEREYGFLFYNEGNKDSYDSNHAVIFKNKISDLNQVLDDIVKFYIDKGIKPIIYQSIFDEGYFEDIKNILSDFGFVSWSEPQRYMVLSERNTITPNTEITVQKISEWQEEYGSEIFEKAEEPWEIAVAKRSLDNENTLFFVAYYNGKPVGMTYAHVHDNVCRVDYLLVSKEHRNIGVGRALISSFVEYCRVNHIENCFLWPAGETAERIYYEAGFRHADTKLAGRASYVRMW
ncbi:MAG: GNAT family N-acetyltransferase [Clostridia bacterium]|nr:GNAT family N-acetyltransferase [Clostridia bacterium]